MILTIVVVIMMYIMIMIIFMKILIIIQNENKNRNKCQICEKLSIFLFFFVTASYSTGPSVRTTRERITGPGEKFFVNR